MIAREWDSHDLTEWIAAQPWCDGGVGMVGISGELLSGRRGKCHAALAAPA